MQAVQAANSVFILAAADWLDLQLHWCSATFFAPAAGSANYKQHFPSQLHLAGWTTRCIGAVPPSFRLFYAALSTALQSQHTPLLLPLLLLLLLLMTQVLGAASCMCTLGAWCCCSLARSCPL